MTIVADQNYPELAELLRVIYRKSAGLPRAQRAETLKVYLAHRLQNVNRAGLVAVLRFLDAQFTKRPISDPGSRRQYGEVDEGQEREVLLNLAKIILPENEQLDYDTGTQELLERVDGVLGQVSLKLRSLAYKLGTAGDSLPNILTCAERRFAAQEQSELQAAEESFVRLLNALNPEGIKKKVTRKALSTDAGYKALLYDNLCEKYQQLKMYHDKGRLVKDHKAIFKKYLRQNLKEIGGL